MGATMTDDERAAEEKAYCRGCGRELKGRAYHTGGIAYIPETWERAKLNFYGGWVCSYDCDLRSSLRVEQTMPGHEASQQRLGLGSPAWISLKNNWKEEP